MGKTEDEIDKTGERFDERDAFELLDSLCVSKKLTMSVRCHQFKKREK